jgi:hypothetical protein
VKYLLSGIARCGKCGAAMYVRPTAKGRAVYICREGNGHLGRSQPHLDAYATTVILDRLATLDLDDLAAESPDTKKSRADATKLRGRLDRAIERYTEGKLSANTLAKIEADLEPRIADAERRARAAAGVSPVVEQLAGKGADARWDALSVEQRREVVRVLLHVTVLPSKRASGSTGFDPQAVKLEWRV